MIKLINMGPVAFKKYIQEKKIYIFGAGKALESALEIYFEDKDIECIIDNNSSKWGGIVSHRGHDIIITSTEMFASIKDKTNAIIFVTSPFYAAEIVGQLDKIDAVNNVECFLQVLIRNTKEESCDFEFTNGPRKIPKKIHYIWVGGKPLPEEYVNNIKTWEKYNPDYEIIQWDETNYDFKKCDYVKEAYDTKSWGFVPNYARLDIIYNEGGIYLDTDVKVFKSFDCLLNDSAFFNMGCADRINQGCGFGAEAHSKIVKDMRDSFEVEHFLLTDGTVGKKPCHTFINPIMKKYGFELKNEYQKKDNVVLYPCEVMSPKTIDGMEDFYSDKTISVHLENGSWRNEREHNGLLKLKELIIKRNMI